MMTQHMFEVDLRTPHTDLLKQQPVIMDRLTAPFSNNNEQITNNRLPTTGQFN